MVVCRPILVVRVPSIPVRDRWRLKLEIHWISRARKGSADSSGVACRPTGCCRVAYSREDRLERGKHDAPSRLIHLIHQTESCKMHPLDNPAWNALNAEHRSFSVGDHLARRYRPSFSPIAALENIHNPECWDSLVGLCQTGTHVALFGLDGKPPRGWNEKMSATLNQLCCNNLTFTRPPVINLDLTMRELDTADGPAMVTLARLTNPGPMEMNTVRLGRYLGLFDKDGVMVAMAGERMRLSHFVEVSGVCTHPDHRGKRYATDLVSRIVQPIIARGHVAFLHAVQGNSVAAKTYANLGFKLRTSIPVTVLQRL
jgi:GNAT superfamily N-acetyltransferase